MNERIQFQDGRVASVVPVSAPKVFNGEFANFDQGQCCWARIGITHRDLPDFGSYAECLILIHDSSVC